MQDGPVRLVPEMATVFHIVRGSVYSSGAWPFWMRWGWCKSSDVLQLINREYSLKWKKRDLLTRFALDRDEIKGSQYAATKPQMGILAAGDKGLYTFYQYTRDLLPKLEKAGEDFYVPAGWVKDVLWAMYGGCTRFKVEDDPTEGATHKRIVAAFQEDGQGIYLI